MKIQVINTIDNTQETFDNLAAANEHIKREINWFNSPNENKNNKGYDESDFIIKEI
jgi:hypothetical protein